VWTSIATGKTEEKHGIEGFMVNTPEPGNTAPTTSNMRKVKAIWQILSAADRKVGVTGWLVTYPADPVNGYLISSHATIALSTRSSARPPNQTDEWLSKGVYPEDIWQEVTENAYNEDDVPESAVELFIESDIEIARREEELRTAGLARFYASDMTSLNLVRHFDRTMPADFTAVYFRGCDMASHFFWRFMEPETWRRELSPDAIAAFAPVVERYYAFADSLLGEAMKLADENTAVMVCSDHGFAGHTGYEGFDGDVAVGTQMHRKQGIIFMSGPGMAAGRTIEGATVLDVAPTILALFGLPVPRDMDGRPLTEAWHPDFLAGNPIDYIDTYEIDAASEGGGTEPVQSPVDEEIKEMLRSLGYID
jgi:predicted AlkP superfamily phosphohydrolase/phosphomutase